MKRIIILLFVCLFVLSGCAKEDVDKTEEPEVEEETETEEPNFGLTDAEIECILKVLQEKNFPVDSIDDIYDIQCLGYCKIYTDAGVEYDYSTKEYGVCLKNGPACNVLIPVEDLE